MAILNQNPTDLVQLIALISSLSESDGLGRIVAELDPNLINRNPTLDIMLEDGDNIYIPRLNSTITIVGNVLNPITVPYNNKFDAKDYIKLAGGYNNTADKNSAYIIYPNGVSKKLRSNLFSLLQALMIPCQGLQLLSPEKLQISILWAY
jgi:polysaccharide export outer membrane protein